MSVPCIKEAFSFISICLLQLVQCSYYRNEGLASNVYRDTPKVWHVYVRKMTEQLMKNSFDGDTSISTVEIMNKNLIQFLEYGNSRSKLFKLVSKDINKFVNLNSYLLVYRPSGVLRHNEEEQSFHTHVEQKSLVLSENYFVFQLNNKLRVQLIFNYIYFSSYQASHCTFGKVTIRSGFLRHTYCGHHPHLITYPPSRIVEIIIMKVGFVDYHGEISYIVMDKEVVISHSTNRYLYYHTSLFWIKNTDTFLYSFYFYVKKFQIVELTISELETFYSLVHDGPGSEFQILWPKLYGKNRTLFVTTTFQCLVNVFSKYDDKNSSTFLDVFRYSAKTQNVTEAIAVERNGSFSFSFPRNCRGNSSDFCIEIISLQVDTGKHLNVTITNIATGRVQNSVCSYSGFSAYDKNYNNSKEISSTCQPHDQFFQLRNIYSKGTFLLLVFYYYYNHSVIQIDGLVSATSCDLVYLNVFKYRALCFGKRVDTPACFEYLDKTAENAHMKLTVNCKDSRKNFNSCRYQFLDVLASEGSCAIVQISYHSKDVTFVQLIGFLEKPMITIGLAPIQITGNIIRFHVLGFVKGK